MKKLKSLSGISKPTPIVIGLYKRILPPDFELKIFSFMDTIKEGRRYRGYYNVAVFDSITASDQITVIIENAKKFGFSNYVKKVGTNGILYSLTKEFQGVTYTLEIWRLLDSTKIDTLAIAIEDGSP